MMDHFRHGLPDFTEKVVTKKLDEQDATSLHANSTYIDEVWSSNRINKNGDTDTSVQNNRDKGSHNTDADQGSAVRGVPQKGYRFLNWRSI